MTVIVGMHEAKTTLSRLVDAAQAGEDVLITRSGEPVARLQAVHRPFSRKVLLDLYAGQIKISEDFAELPEDIARALGAVD